MGTGQLRVYFGAAPGVGKTYKMLEEGHRRLERGTDVVIGFVETHGRKLTAELIEGTSPQMNSFGLAASPASVVNDFPVHESFCRPEINAPAGGLSLS